MLDLSEEQDKGQCDPFYEVSRCDNTETGKVSLCQELQGLQGPAKGSGFYSWCSMEPVKGFSRRGGDWG
jgi:hypothetical protein